MSNPEWIWFLMGAALLVYVSSGGADFGAGFWYLVAPKERRVAHRQAIRTAIAPIWEANHVWLIFIVVLCFTVFPRAFQVAGTALHIPLTLVLIGIVLRGSAFVFHAYGMGPHEERRWGMVFGASSIVTPIFLGMVFSSLSSGEIRAQDGYVTSGYFTGWFSVFSVLLGILVLTIFALLAAIYLTVDAPDSIKEDFRRRALFTQVVLILVSMLTFAFLSSGAPPIWQSFHKFPIMWGVVAINGLTVVATLLALWKRAYFWARKTAVAQVGLVIFGWGVGMRGYMIYPDVRLLDAGTRSETIASLNIGIPLGLVLIVPALVVLFKIFKSDVKKSAKL